MSNKSNKNGILSGMAWSFGERILAQAVSVIVTIILARILNPEHYGIISIVTIFISFCNVFVTSGFGSSIIQKKNADECDFNTAFWLSLLISIILYLVLFFAAPFISKFYNIEELTLVIRIMSLRLPIASLNNIQQSYLRREMKFKKFFFATLIGTVLSAILGIIIAINGGGVWALVTQYLTNVCIDTIFLLFVCGWVPKFEFSLKKAKSIFSFGWKVLITDLSFTIETDLRSLIIGKVFGGADLAYYDQGKKYTALVVDNINATVTKVMLPAYSKSQDNIDKMKEILRKSVRCGIYVLAPLLIGFSLIANNFVRVILTEKWLDAVPFIQLFCFVYITRPLETSCHQALLALGKSGLVLIIMSIISTFGLATTIIAVFVYRNVLLVVIGLCLSTILSLSLFSISIKKNIGYKFKEQFSDIFSSLAFCAVMAIFVALCNFLPYSPLIVMIIQIVVGGLVYIGLSIIFKDQSFIYIKNKILYFLNRKVRTHD